jgi:ABC-2 type transport system permease protein
MNWRRLRSIIRKELIQAWRDKPVLGLFLLAPLLQLAFFGFAVNADLRGVKVGVVLEDPSPDARRLIEAIQQAKASDNRTKVLEVTRVSMGYADSQKWLEEGTHWLEEGTIQVVLHIPRGFTRALSNGQAPVVQVLSDGSDANTATLAFQYLSGAAMLWASQARVDHFRRHPEAAIRFAAVPQVQIVSRFWYNPDLRSTNYMIPGVLTVILLVIAMSHTALMVVKEKELGTIEQINVTPIRAAELLVGKTAPPLVLGLIAGVLITVVARFGFHVPLKGSIPCLFVCAFLYLMSTMGMGLLISIKCPNLLLAQLISNVLISPLLVLSGFLFPIQNMPLWAQGLSYLVPTYYFMEVVRGVFLKGQGFLELWPQIVRLTVLGLVFYLAGIVFYRKRAD